jgi:type II secretory pathway pseudopilin PulG
MGLRIGALLRGVLRRLIPSTAIEWIIIVLIVGALSAVALPNYQDYLSRARVSDRVLAARALGGAVKGTSVLSAPPNARQYKEFEVRLVVSADELGKAVRQMLSASPPGTNVEGKEVLVHERMSAQLIGKDFVVSPTEPKAQWIVDPAKGATWVWTVYGVWPGDRRLYARLNALIKVGDREAEHSFDVAEHTIAVQVNPAEMALRNIELLITAIAIPAIGFLLARWWSKRAPQDAKPQRGGEDDSSRD